MTTQRTSTILRQLLALAIGVFTLVLLGTLVVGHARATGTVGVTAAPVVQTKGTIVEFGNDVLVPAGERVDAVLAAGGDVTIDGTVRDSVVAFGGDVLVRGTVGSSVVAFGGDVNLAPTASVGGSKSATDKSVVLFGGSLTRAAGAQVKGQVQHYDNANWTGSVPWGASHLFNQPLWWGFSLIGWLVQTAICLILGLVAAALMPKQMRAVQRHLAQKPAASLGWGALTFFLIAPAILVVLVISIVGLLLVLPYVVVVALFYFFVVTSVGAFIAQRVLAGTQQKDNLMLAVTLGVVATTIVARVPVVGGLVGLVMVVFGTGAAVLAFSEWRRAKRLAAAPHPAAPAAAPAPAGVAFATAEAAPAAVAVTAVAPAGGTATAVVAPQEAAAVAAPPESAAGAETAQTEVAEAATEAGPPAAEPAPPAEGPPAGEPLPPAT
jgi:hypothetical protein